jgi:hypothetical protein
MTVCLRSFQDNLTDWRVFHEARDKRLVGHQEFILGVSSVEHISSTLPHFQQTPKFPLTSAVSRQS